VLVAVALVVALVVAAVREAMVAWVAVAEQVAAVALVEVAAVVAPVLVVAIYLNAGGLILPALTSCMRISQPLYYVHGGIDGTISPS
jgi:hypothetical protein